MKNKAKSESPQAKQDPGGLEGNESGLKVERSGKSWVEYWREQKSPCSQPRL